MVNIVKKYDKVGVGLMYPVVLDSNGNPITVTGNELVRQSILTLLTTTAPSFFIGELKCRIDEILFEPNDEILISLLDYFIRDVVSSWEKRTRIVSIIYDQKDNGLILCSIGHRLIGETKVDTFVFPFYSGLKY